MKLCCDEHKKGEWSLNLKRICECVCVYTCGCICVDVITFALPTELPPTPLPPRIKLSRTARDKYWIYMNRNLLITLALIPILIILFVVNFFVNFHWPSFQNAVQPFLPCVLYWVAVYLSFCVFVSICSPYAPWRTWWSASLALIITMCLIPFTVVRASGWILPLWPRLPPPPHPPAGALSH